MNFSCFKTLFFINFLITYNSTTNYFLPCIQRSLSILKLVTCHAFLQERIQKSSPRIGKKAFAILRGRAQKDVFPYTQEQKNGGRVQKNEK